jgi:hypothetical protein
MPTWEISLDSALLREAGLAEVTEPAPQATILGRVSYWRASA